MKTKESAGGIVVNPAGKIVLVCQHNNSWSFPKGGVEEGEEILTAAKREIQEETGVDDLELVRVLPSYERYSIGKDGVGENIDWGIKTRHMFLFTTSSPLPKPRDPDGEITETRWVSVEEALQLLTHPKDREFLESVRDSVRDIIEKL